MSDNKLRCALVYRIGAGGEAVCLAKYDHAGQYETHGGADSSLYGGRDKAFAEAVSGVISNDPPTGLSESGKIGGFKVVQSDQHQVIYGCDMDGLCMFYFIFPKCTVLFVFLLLIVLCTHWTIKIHIVYIIIYIYIYI